MLYVRCSQPRHAAITCRKTHVDFVDVWWTISNVKATFRRTIIVVFFNRRQKELTHLTVQNETVRLWLCCAMSTGFYQHKPCSRHCTVRRTQCLRHVKSHSDKEKKEYVRRPIQPLKAHCLQSLHSGTVALWFFLRSLSLRGCITRYTPFGPSVCTSIRPVPTVNSITESHTTFKHVRSNWKSNSWGQRSRSLRRKNWESTAYRVGHWGRIDMFCMRLYDFKVLDCSVI